MRLDKSHGRRIGERERERGMILPAVGEVDGRARERKKP